MRWVTKQNLLRTFWGFEYETLAIFLSQVAATEKKTRKEQNKNENFYLCHGG